MVNRPAIVVTDFELLKETVIKDGASYTGRLENPFSRVVRGGDYGIIETTGALWQQQRRFVLHVLRDFDENSHSDHILAEVTDLLRKCDKFVEKKLDLRDYIDTAVGSVINSLLFGFRFDESNTDIFLHRKAVVKQIMELSARPAFILWMFYPWLSYLPWYWKYDRGTKEKEKTLYDLFDSQIEAHKVKINFDSEGSTDYVEAFLKEQKKHEDEPESGGFS
ncbi:unnamed protein product [Cylicostephanus goldi]|uniref:Cytochrome P450 n=1 Tax=Cylicostephanus goldi TaxID=71465 RepID=A0A3P7MZV7_CYLGO|nr:unnamed protein product [Cylicostephanus goldi]